MCSAIVGYRILRETDTQAMAKISPDVSQKLTTSQSLPETSKVFVDQQKQMPMPTLCFCGPDESVTVIAATETSLPKGSYNVVLEALKHNFPADATCAMFCGGKKCKYCCAASWKPEDQAIAGLYSHWVTDDILAMSRPMNENIEKFGIIESFKQKGIKSIFNMQKRGEHADCGSGLQSSSEFSYDAQQFMDSGVYVYNYAWSDFGSAETFSAILDAVNVMQFALSEGKVAVHCHAGLGRTGLLIACYFIYAHGNTASEAINFVRSKRPKSVQTSLQVNFAIKFEQFLKPFRAVFSDSSVPSFTFSQFMHRQRQILHGYEGRLLKHIPKIVHAICERLLALTGRTAVRTLSSPTGDSDPASSGRSSSGDGNAVEAAAAAVVSVDAACAALLLPRGSGEWAAAAVHKCESYAKDLSLDGRSAMWAHLSADEDDPVVLATLLWQWLAQLKEPVITAQDTNLLLSDVASAGLTEDEDGEPTVNAKALLVKLNRDVATTLDYVAKVLGRLEPLPGGTKLALVHQLVGALIQAEDFDDAPGADSADGGGGTSSPPASPEHVPRMTSAEQDCLIRFMYALVDSKSEDNQSHR